VVCAGVLASRKDTDARLLSLLRDELLSPGSVEELQRDVNKIFADAKQHAGVDQETRAARARALNAEISRLVDGIATVGVSEALANRLRAAEAARAALSNEPIALPVAAPPDITAHYKQLVLDLQTALETDADRARTVMGEIFDSITLSQEGPETWADVESHAGRTLIAAASGVSLTVVAGTRFRNWK
jgi:site-specific DNA recombinase